MATQKPDLTRIWANGAPSGNVVDPDTTTPGKVNSGWQAEVPPFEHFNFLQKWFSQGLAYNNEQGVNVYDTNTDYESGGIVKGTDGLLYLGLATNGPGSSLKNPIGDTTGTWRKITSLYNIDRTQSVFVEDLANVSIILASGYATISDGGAGAVWVTTGNVIGGSAGTADRTIGVIYDKNGVEFVYTGSVVDILHFGADSTGVSDVKVATEELSQFSKHIYFPSNKGEIYLFSGAPTLASGTTCSFDRADAFSGATTEELNAKIQEFGVIHGYPFIPELRGKRIEIVAGTLRQNSVTPAQWDWIKDSNHEPVGVDDSTPAIASGSELTIPYLKTYSRVLSFISGPDEDFANGAGMIVGGSVGLGLTNLKASINQTLSAHIRWTGSAMGITYGAGQGGTSDFNVNITSAVYASGNLTVTHQPIFGTNLNLTGHSNGGAIAPYTAVIKSQSDTVTVINFVTPAGAIYVAGGIDELSLQFNKQFDGGVLLDGTGGSDTLDFDKGNIWFYGIFEV